MLRRLLVCLALALSLGTAAPALAQAAPACQFILGFATLHALDPADVGACVDNQAFAANGDAQQHTTNGLLAWRKADNWTAFTNGYWTWINGPDGLAKRLNTQRFGWEANPDGLPVVGTAPALSRFVGRWTNHASAFTLRQDGSAELVWRTYAWCGPGVPPPCDQMVNNVIVDGGHAVAMFDQVRGDVAYGRVQASTDPTGVAIGAISFALLPNGTVRLSQVGGRLSSTLCNPAHYDSYWCGA